MKDLHFISTLLLLAVFALLFTIIALYHNRRKQKSLNDNLKKLADFKEQTAYMIIHDLKVPLATLSNIELIDNESLQKKMIKQASKRMLILVQNVLDVYKYENTNFKLIKERIEINKLIEECVSEFKVMGEIKKLLFKIELLENTAIVADRIVLSRIISNILSNAIKFSPIEGVIKITPTLSDNVLEIKFKNQGPGISKEKQNLIFNRFEQAQDIEFNKISSTGLGLTFCKMAVNAHKGDIGVNSDSKEGAEFWIQLPQ